MASRDPPKKEGQGKSMPKQEALNAHVTKLCTSLKEIMADGEMSGQESSATETPLMTHQTDRSRSAPTDGLRRRESYCLLVRVVKDALRLSEWDVRLPAHAWNEDIAIDICESQIGCPPGTYKVQLLSNTEFLLRKRPTSGLEMNWQDANAVIRLIHGGISSVWSSGFSSSWTSLQERGKIRPECYFPLPAHPGPGANGVEQIPEGQQEVCYQPKGDAAPRPGYDTQGR